MNAKSILTQWLANGDLDRSLRGLEWMQNQYRMALDTDLVLQKAVSKRCKTTAERSFTILSTTMKKHSSSPCSPS